MSWLAFRNNKSLFHVVMRQTRRNCSTLQISEDENCIFSKTITTSRRVIYTVGITKQCEDRFGIEFVDVVPVGTRVEGGIRPSMFAYVEGAKGSVQLLIPELIEYGEIVSVNADLKTTPNSAVMPPGFLVRIDAGEEDEE
jgi:glycine cleavage system H lipoate-binding protein